MTGIVLQEGQSDLPSRDSTASYWHKEPRLIGHHTTEKLPSEVDTVVVGSGITGAFAAREVVAGGRGVLLLESREVCWGATGRNGGHCQPSIITNLPHLARFEIATYTFIKSLVNENNNPCDWRTVFGIHAITSPIILDLVKERISQLQPTHPDLAAQLRLTTDEDELAELRLGMNVVGAVVQSCAARLWPYKLVAWILEQLLKHGSERFNLQTNTSVTHLQKYRKKWIVLTDRGQVCASNVILATNAYTSYLLPKFTGLIMPVRGQVGALQGGERLKHSYVWKTQEEGDAGENEDYLVQTDAGDLILGGERNCTADGGRGVSADNTVDPVVAHRLKTALNKTLTSFPEELPATHQWTGIMGYSADKHPWVGLVPESLGGGKGLLIAAGYTGHGMPVAARCGVAVGQMVLGTNEGENGVKVPLEWQIGDGQGRTNFIRMRNSMTGVTIDDR